jgi:hypothetical protein
MNIDQISNPPSRKPLRLWPGVVAVVLQWLAWFVFPAVFPAIAIYGLLFGGFAALVIVLWWLFFSRAPWLDRVGAIVVMPIAVVAARPIAHASIANGGLIILLSIPLLSLALVAWAVVARRFSGGVRLATLVASMFLACGVLTLIRISGVTGGAHLDIHWRWTPTPEQRLLVQTREETVLPSPAPAPPSPAPAPSRAAATTPE